MSETPVGPPTSCTILLLAAGRSSRMRGADKLMELVDGEPLIRNRARICLATGMKTIVVLPKDRIERAVALDDTAVEQVVSQNAHMGLSHSLRDGIAHVTTDLAMIMLADLPALTTDDLSLVMSRAHTTGARITRGATQTGQPGHPVVVHRSVFPELRALSGDQGAQPVLQSYEDRTELVTLPGRNAILDLDTPEDWARWRGDADAS